MSVKDHLQPGHGTAGRPGSAYVSGLLTLMRAWRTTLLTWRIRPIWTRRDAWTRVPQSGGDVSVRNQPPGPQDGGQVVDVCAVIEEGLLPRMHHHAIGPLAVVRSAAHEWGG